MQNFVELNKAWIKAIRAHSETPLVGEDGKEYRAIGGGSLAFLERVWAARRAPLPDIGKMIEDGKDVRFWSDPHFGHEAIIAMCRRPFSGVEEMDECIWANVEKAAKEADFLLCLGDLAIRESWSLQRRLHDLMDCRQVTLSGNHDRKNNKPALWVQNGGIGSLAFSLPTALLREWFNADFALRLGDLIDWKKLPSRINFGVCHFPIPPSRMPGPSWVCLHGHSHGKAWEPLRVDFSMEAIEYRPVSLRNALTPEFYHALVRRQDGLDGMDGEASPDEDDGFRM